MKYWLVGAALRAGSESSKTSSIQVPCLLITPDIREIKNVEWMIAELVEGYGMGYEHDESELLLSKPLAAKIQNYHQGCQRGTCCRKEGWPRTRPSIEQ